MVTGNLWDDRRSSLFVSVNREVLVQHQKIFHFSFDISHLSLPK